MTDGRLTAGQLRQLAEAFHSRGRLGRMCGWFAIGDMLNDMAKESHSSPGKGREGDGGGEMQTREIASGNPVSAVSDGPDPLVTEGSRIEPTGAGIAPGPSPTLSPAAEHDGLSRPAMPAFSVTSGERIEWPPSAPAPSTTGEALKPCPFCGLTLHRVDWHKTLWSGHAANCYLVGQLVFDSDIAAWNRRSTPTPAAEREGGDERVREWREGPHSKRFRSPAEEILWLHENGDALAAEVERLTAELAEHKRWEGEAIAEGIQEAKDDADNFDKDLWCCVRQIMQARPGFSWDEYRDGVDAQAVFDFFTEEFRALDEASVALTSARSDIATLTRERDEARHNLTVCESELERRNLQLEAAEARCKAMETVVGAAEQYRAQYAVDYDDPRVHERRNKLFDVLATLPPAASEGETR